MTKPDLGTKRLCTECGARYYDLSATPIICPKCGARFQLVAPSAQRPAVRQPTVTPRKPEATSPDPPDTLIETLDEDNTDVSEIIDGKEKGQQDT
jgi:uncharacterized protein (TIGR02300 family)